MLQSSFCVLRNAEKRLLIVLSSQHCKQTVSCSTMNHPVPVAKELKLPNPYGHIAAKAWGDETGYPVLALHGWQDNAGTFDRLIPLLSPSLHIVAIDLPGHGLSSHKPPNTIYHQMEYIIDIHRLTNFLKWERFSILGHSYGGILSFIYASIFPDKIKDAVVLDVMKPVSSEVDALPKKSRRGINSLLDLELKINNPAPVYSYEDAKKRLIDGTFDEITSEAADALLVRGTRRPDCGSGFVFTRDIRIRVTSELQSFSHETLKAYMRNLRCNLLLLTAKDSRMKFLQQNEKLEFLEIYEQNCKSFKHIEVVGNHFVHLNNPDIVAPHINEFFLKQMNSSKL